MRFVHSCCGFELLLGGYALDRHCDLRCIIESGKFVLPWAILLHMPLDVLHQITEAFPLMIPCALIMHIAERPFNGIGPRAICWQPEQGKSWLVCQPLLNSFGFMDAIIIDHHIDPGHLGSSVG